MSAGFGGAIGGFGGAAGIGRGSPLADGGGYIFVPGQGWVHIPPWTPPVREVQLDAKTVTDLENLSQQAAEIESKMRELLVAAVQKAASKPAAPTLRMKVPYRAGPGWVIYDYDTNTCYYVHD